ncbi:hypothetical protein CEXT_720001 [Caerostris extrusa]|uniref:Uncharacterized protein n=1 Tax=Caerostris extrusa TaxID=172846 RepID=A0AAV4T6P7_CAEEX|nr:hypothetical protein CEXT_720001 [Caerostris extrusa]
MRKTAPAILTLMSQVRVLIVKMIPPSECTRKKSQQSHIFKISLCDAVIIKGGDTETIMVYSVGTIFDTSSGGTKAIFRAILFFFQILFPIAFPTRHLRRSSKQQAKQIQKSQIKKQRQKNPLFDLLLIIYAFEQ